MIVAPSAYPLGGVATWLDGLVDGLRQRGWRLQVALLAGAHHDVDRYLASHPLGELRRIESSSGSREGRQRELASAINAARAELLLAVNVGDIEDAVDGIRRSGGSAPRLVTTQHAIQRDFYDHLRSRRKVVDGVVVTNRLGVELAREYSGLEAERIAYAPYGVAFGTPAASRSEQGPLRIAWAGRLDQRQKRIDDLPAICERLVAAGIDYRLDVAGSGPGAKVLEEALMPFERVGRVRRLGELPQREVRERLYEENEVLLITSSWETGPIVAWEALAAGLAVVSSTYLGSGRESALRDGETALLFPVGDAAAAAAALARVCDAGLRQRLVSTGQTEVARRYTLSASLDAWEAALYQLAALPPRSARTVGERIPPAGRLDRWLGVRHAETVRRRLGIARRQGSPGAEWPHALAESGDEGEFLRLATELDRPPSATPEAAR